jgi:hypothetical protein
MIIVPALGNNITYVGYSPAALQMTWDIGYFRLIAARKYYTEVLVGFD